MKILGIDTTTKYLALGVFDGAKVSEYNLDLGTRHSALLMPTIQRVLEALGWRINDIDYFACGLGPGSFTGIRVGLATIKGLSWSLHKPVVGLSTLDILAQGVKESDKFIIPIIDAKRKLIYSTIFKQKKGKLFRLKAYMLLEERKLIKFVKAGSIILGDATPLFKERLLKNKAGISFLDRDCWYPKGHNIIELALARIREDKISNAFKIKPIYLYPKECQIKKG